MRIRRVMVRVVVIASLALSVLVVAGWARSCFVADWVTRAAGEIQAPLAAAPTPSDPFAADWRYHHRTLTVRHDCGLLYLVKTEYTSYRGRPEELKDWEQRRGWEYQAPAPGGVVVKQPAHFTTILDWSALGAWVQPFSKQGEEGHSAALPYALLLALVGWPAAWWGLHAWRAARRGRAGRCIACGYDLRGARSVCPECGAEPSPDSVATRGGSSPSEARR